MPFCDDKFGDRPPFYDDLIGEKVCEIAIALPEISEKKRRDLEETCSCGNGVARR